MRGILLGDYRAIDVVVLLGGMAQYGSGGRFDVVLLRGKGLRYGMEFD
jgi:hypothetical protein